MKKLGIIAALPAEAKCFQINELSFETPIEIEKNVFLYISGIGYESSLNATKKMVKLNVDGLISWGIAGAISNSINSGDMVIARSVINHRNIYSTSHEWQKKIIWERLENAGCRYKDKSTEYLGVNSCHKDIVDSTQKFNEVVLFFNNLQEGENEKYYIKQMK